MRKPINKKDINGVPLLEGDIIAECKVDSDIWDGQGIIKRRPLGIIVTYNDSRVSKISEPEEADFYNVVQIRKGLVELTDSAEQWMKNEATGSYMEFYLSAYDGKFYAWDNIEKVGSIYDMVD